MDGVMNLQDCHSWPEAVRDFLSANEALFQAQRTPSEDWMESERRGREFDRLHDELEELLARFSMTGYHCTRLTEAEIAEVQANGLQPLSPELLNWRIRRLDLPNRLRERLCLGNDAGERSRQGKIWFCLFPPVEEAMGVEPFFRCWGGESLYRWHEDDPEMGPILRRIGTPCAVELRVPIRLMQLRYFTIKILKRWLGHEHGPIKCEDWCVQPLDSSHVVNVYRHPEKAFHDLTGWKGRGRLFQ